jgi:transglutaminase-like putative cysteine protease
MIESEIETRLGYTFHARSHVRLALLVRTEGGEQQLEREALEILSENGDPIFGHWFTDGIGNRSVRFSAPAGKLAVAYRATVHSEPQSVGSPKEWQVNELPNSLLQWISPSRYCESDLLGPIAMKMFGKTTPGVPRVQAILGWVKNNIEYCVGSTNANTRASDVLQLRQGVCRDFAHLCVAFCRALNLPTRFVSGYTYFDTPPQDFHAVIEVWLGRWIRFDPTGMAPVERLVCTGVGEDAKNVAFMTCWGPMQMDYMRLDITQTDLRTGDRLVGDNSIQIMGSEMGPEMGPEMGRETSLERAPALRL